jgi:hypothetical protein
MHRRVASDADRGTSPMAVIASAVFSEIYISLPVLDSHYVRAPLGLCAFVIDIYHIRPDKGD